MHFQSYSFQKNSHFLIFSRPTDSVWKLILPVQRLISSICFIRFSMQMFFFWSGNLYYIVVLVREFSIFFLIKVKEIHHFFLISQGQKFSAPAMNPWYIRLNWESWLHIFLQSNGQTSIKVSHYIIRMKQSMVIQIFVVICENYFWL